MAVPDPEPPRGHGSACFGLQTRREAARPPAPRRPPAARRVVQRYNGRQRWQAERRMANANVTGS